MLTKILINFSILLFSITAAAVEDKIKIPAANPSVKQIRNAGTNQLLLSVGSFDPLTEELDFSTLKFSGKPSEKYKIIQFHDTEVDTEWLIKQGVSILSYLPNNAFIVKNNNSLKNILNDQKIRWSGSYLSNYKIPPQLWETQLKSQESYQLIVSVFKDFPGKNIPLLLQKYLPEIKLNGINSRNDFFLEVNRNNFQSVLNTLSQIEEVHFIDLVKPMRFTNTEAVSPIQAGMDSGSSPTNDNYTPVETPIWDKGLNGSGQIVGVADGGLDSDEDWFVHYDNGVTVTHEVTQAENTSPPTLGTLYPDRKVIGYFTMPGAIHYDATGHGTHVTGSVAGDRLQAIDSGPAGEISSPFNPGYDNDDGMAPNAQILFQDLGGEDSDGEPALTGQGSYPMWQQAYNAGVRIHSNSYGADGDGAYSFSDLYLDDHLRNYEQMLIVFAAGNDGPQDNTIGSPANAKNALSVGALGHGNLRSPTAFSSRGPTDDGRIKPDIMATGSAIESAENDNENTGEISAPSRTTKSGTSMATPITSGAAAMVRQYYTDGFYPTGASNSPDAHNPTGPLLKATLINGANTDGGHFNQDVGWGRVKLTDSIMFNDSDRQMRVWEIENNNGLKTDQSIEFKLGVKSGQKLNVTLVWYDVAGPFGSSKTLINDLDLTVSGNGNTYKGNVFSSLANSGTGGEYDRLNTVEQVRIKEPEDGIYTITVKAEKVPGDGTLNSFRQGFALVATGDFEDVNGISGTLTNVNQIQSQMQGVNGIKLDWSGAEHADFYEIYRAEGNCSTADFKNARYAGKSESSTFTDFRTQNGMEYAYKIRAAQYKTLGSLSDVCTDIISEQACDYLPSFDESSVSVADNSGDLCHTKLQWNAASSNCPTSPNIKYNIYRSESNDFIPSESNLIATVNNTFYDDIYAPDTPTYYIVRAEDNNPTGTGPNGGTETTGTSRIRSQAVGTGFTNTTVLEDVDNVAIMNLSFPWQVVSNKSADGQLSYKTGEANSNYPANSCRAIVTNTISLDGSDPNPEISYKTLYNLEQNWDGVVVEISTDDGVSWSDFPPDGGYPGDFSETTANPVNACGYSSSHGAFSGSNNNFELFTHDLTDYVGQNVKIRWQLSSDPASEFEGFYIDSIQYPSIQVPNSCTVNTAPDKIQPGFYYDKERSGHGFVIEPVTDTNLYFTVFYTYKDDGTPEWYVSTSELENNVLNIDMNDDTLLRVNRDFNIDPTGTTTPNTIDTSVGTNILQIDFNHSTAAASAACQSGNNRGDNISLALWQLGDTSGEWCLEPLINSSEYPDPDFGGTWWTGVDDDGWGISLAFSGDLIVATVYYFDNEGKPRWVIGTQSGFQTGQEISIDMTEVTGYGRNSPRVDTTTVSAGTLTLTLNNNNGDENDGTLDINLTYQGLPGQTPWVRENVPVILFTVPHD